MNKVLLAALFITFAVVLTSCETIPVRKGPVRNSSDDNRQ